MDLHLFWIYGKYVLQFDRNYYYTFYVDSKNANIRWNKCFCKLKTEPHMSLLKSIKVIKRKDCLIDSVFLFANAFINYESTNMISQVLNMHDLYSYLSRINMRITAGNNLFDLPQGLSLHTMHYETWCIFPVLWYCIECRKDARPKCNKHIFQPKPKK